MPNISPQLCTLSCERVIEHLLKLIHAQGFKPIVHFELEGVYEAEAGFNQLDYLGVNRALSKLNIDGELKTEFWRNQWEYVSLFNGQSPLKEAENLARAMWVLPSIMQQHGAKKVEFKPVAWAADKGRYVPGSKAIFSTDTRLVHIPNAIQMNISVENVQGENLVPVSNIGEWLQYQLLQTSYDCCLLFLPEEDAFKRLTLRKDYALDAELSSPFTLSGGHQGSIALYKQWGKHNQAMGLEPQFYGLNNTVLSYSGDWKKTARVEHRLGATSRAYDPYLNILFILLNTLDALQHWQACEGMPPSYASRDLPSSMYDDETMGNKQLGAITVFEKSDWFANSIDRYCADLDRDLAGSLGEGLKAKFLQQFKPKCVTYNASTFLREIRTMTPKSG
ncbi:MAG: hypothetical protein ACI8Z9_001533 [Paraglaciecola sp.]|jgi:hypothetical protein